MKNITSYSLSKYKFTKYNSCLKASYSSDKKNSNCPTCCMTIHYKLLQQIEHHPISISGHSWNLWSIKINCVFLRTFWSVNLFKLFVCFCFLFFFFYFYFCNISCFFFFFLPVVVVRIDFEENKGLTAKHPCGRWYIFQGPYRTLLKLTCINGSYRLLMHHTLDWFYFFIIFHLRCTIFCHTWWV